MSITNYKFRTIFAAAFSGAKVLCAFDIAFASLEFRAAPITIERNFFISSKSMAFVTGVSALHTAKNPSSVFVSKLYTAVFAKSLRRFSKSKFGITFHIAKFRIFVCKDYGFIQFFRAVFALHADNRINSDNKCNNNCDNDPDYFAAGIERVKRETAQMDMFADAPKIAQSEQLSLDTPSK